MSAPLLQTGLESGLQSGPQPELLIGAQAATHQGPAGPDLAGYLLTCGLILALVLVAAWLFRKFLAVKLRARASARSLQVIDVLPLGSRQRLVVVRCYDRTFLLGQGDKEVRAISELDLSSESTDPEVIPAASPQSRKPLQGTTTGKPGNRAAEAFARILGRAGAGASGSVAVDMEVNDSLPLAALQPKADGADAVSSPQGDATEVRPQRPFLRGGRGILG